MKSTMVKFFSGLFGIQTTEQWQELLLSRTHPKPISDYRAKLISERLSFFALIFSILMPAWILVDMLILPAQYWEPLAVLRLISGGLFFGIWRFSRRSFPSLKFSLVSLFGLLIIPLVFYFISTQFLFGIQLTWLQQASINLYSLLPYLIIAALSLFALTIREFYWISLPIIGFSLLMNFPENTDQIPDAITKIWLLFLLLLTSFFSSIQQMKELISQVTKASYDQLTKAMTRRTGIQTMEVLYRAAVLQSQPMTVLFIDLDHFKDLNDTFGHSAGDKGLINAVQAMKAATRSSDAVIRWGGEEFLVVLPNTDCYHAKIIVERIYTAGLGFQPDGQPLTVSMGLAEFQTDHLDDWHSMVELADKRLYIAKETGRARCIGHDNELVYEQEI